MFIDGERPGADDARRRVLGEHSEQILGELGLDRDAIAELKAAKVV